MTPKHVVIGTIHKDDGHGDNFFAVTSEVSRDLTASMLWRHIQRVESRMSYTERDEETLRVAKQNVESFTKKCREQKVPQWLIDKAIELAETNESNVAPTMDNLYRAFPEKDQNFLEKE